MPKSRLLRFFSAFSVSILIAFAYSVSVHAEYDGNAGLGSEEFTYQKFLDLLDVGKPSTVKDALELIKKEHPDYLAYYTLVYESLSLQEASFQSPRAIVFGRDARLVMTFNGEGVGDSHPMGSDSIEIMRFDGERKHFEFRQIVFRDDAHPDDPYTSKAPYVISQPNSTVTQQGACLLCHGADPRPNWEAYSTWPGVYGSLDDFNDSHLTREILEYQKFKKSATERDRYSVLAANSAAPRPNHDLGILLTGLNTQRALDIMMHNPKAMARKYAILHALACPPPSVLEREIHDVSSADSPVRSVEIPASPLTPLEEDTRDRIVDNLTTKLQRVAAANAIPLESLFEPFTVFGLGEAAKLFGLPPGQEQIADAYANSVLGIKETLAVASLRGILEPAGIDMGNWSLPLGGQSFVFDEPSSNSINLPLQLIFAKPFLNAAFTDPADKSILLKFKEWVKPKPDARPPSADEVHDCKLLMEHDRLTSGL